MPPVVFPQSLRVIFDIFHNELNAQRTYTDHGAQSLTDMHYAAWQFNTGVRLTPFEIRALRRLDDLALMMLLEQSGKG